MNNGVMVRFVEAMCEDKEFLSALKRMKKSTQLCGDLAAPENGLYGGILDQCRPAVFYVLQDEFIVGVIVEELAAWFNH